MPVTLAFDTSADFCAAALVRDGRALAARSLEMSRGHAEALVPLVQELCVAADLPLAAADSIAVTVGPGSFTGVRTGIAAARGFGLATGAPVVGVSSLEAVARGARHSGTSPLLVVLETRRADYFAQLFTADGAALDPPAVIDGDGLARLVSTHRPRLAGNAVSRLLADNAAVGQAADGRAPGPGVPDPVDVAEIATRYLDTGGVASDTLSPLYLRQPEAKLPPRGGRLKTAVADGHRTSE